MTLCFASCESEYSRTVKRELKSGVQHNDLIFDLKMGQTQKEFYDRCWELNKQKKVSQGSGNKFAKYILVLDSLSENAENVKMLFYGIFDEEKVMYGMHMKLTYLKWSPWNEVYQAGPLMEKLKTKYEKDYPGNSFIPIQIEEDIQAFAKIDGNRQILMYPMAKGEVTVKIEDLNVKQSIKNNLN